MVLGLLFLALFARVALEVATAVVPPYRSRFSKHQFTQPPFDRLRVVSEVEPQLLAVLCRMRYQDWTFRETEVRLREHRELRRVLQLQSVPDYTTLYRFLKRLDEQKIDPALGEAARRLGTVGRRRRARVAVDATGLAQGAVSTLLRAAHVSSHRAAASLAALAEMAGDGRCGSATAAVPDGSPGSRERLCQPARLGGDGQPRGPHRTAAGRCGV